MHYKAHFQSTKRYFN